MIFFRSRFRKRAEACENSNAFIYKRRIINLRKNESINLVQYLYFRDAKLEEAVKDCEVRYTRRNLDSIDLLEEIIAKERLNEFREVTADILNILRLSEEKIAYNSICPKCINNSKCYADECDKFRDDLTNLVVDCKKYKSVLPQ